MPIARVLSCEPRETLLLHMRRLGLPGTDVEALARAMGASAVLLTGIPASVLPALQGVSLATQARCVAGDPSRAAGSAMVAGPRAALEACAAELVALGGPAADLGRALGQALARAMSSPEPTRIGPRVFEWGRRTYIMGILNVTPDSFSDGGLFHALGEAVARGEQLEAEGADIIDVGGESTRPGAEPVSAKEEIARVIPVVERLATRLRIPISVDTRKAEVARVALQAGASLVNDISGFRDPEMASVLARHQAAACAMHIQGEPRTMQEKPSYFDVVGEVIEGLQASLDAAERAGVSLDRVLIDPGIGFGKTAGHNLFLLRHLRQLRTLGRPILVGASRKSFIGKVTGRPVGERLAGSLAILAAAVMGGADVVRVHDVADSAAAARMADAVLRAGEGGLAFEV